MSQPSEGGAFGRVMLWLESGVECHGRDSAIKMDSRELVIPCTVQDSGSMCQPQARMWVFDGHPLSECNLWLSLLASRVNSCYLWSILIRGPCLSLLNELRFLAHAASAFSTIWILLKSSSGLFIYLSIYFASTITEVNQCVLFRWVVQLGYNALRNSPSQGACVHLMVTATGHLDTLGKRNLACLFV